MKTIDQHFKKMSTKVVMALVFLCFFSIQTTRAQAILDSQNRVDVTLDDGTTVVLYGKAKTRDKTFSSEYLYLPVNLHLSKRADGTPEFLFLKYTTEERADAGGTQGAL